ncbi:MAG: MoaD/ThiS family protein [Anaerolineae bacterium]|nr:MoaD/ThiS family protein [Anaerolineales bacterium]MCQ3976072.1 MoaD/ThiS family protein [Anaerolineae bacterium]
MEIKVYATLRDVVGGPSVQLNDGPELTVGQMLQELCARYPELRPKLALNEDELHPAVHILVNGRDMRYLNGLETRLTAKDTIRIFPPVGGG